MNLIRFLSHLAAVATCVGHTTSCPLPHGKESCRTSHFLRSLIRLSFANRKARLSVLVRGARLCHALLKALDSPLNYLARRHPKLKGYRCKPRVSVSKVQILKRQGLQFAGRSCRPSRRRVSSLGYLTPPFRTRRNKYTKSAARGEASSWLVGLLVCWLVGWLVGGWLVGWLVGAPPRWRLSQLGGGPLGERA